MVSSATTSLLKELWDKRCSNFRFMLKYVYFQKRKTFFLSQFGKCQYIVIQIMVEIIGLIAFFRFFDISFRRIYIKNLWNWKCIWQKYLLFFFKLKPVNAIRPLGYSLCGKLVTSISTLILHHKCNFHHDHLNVE